MKRKFLILLALTTVLLLAVVGCKAADNSLEGKNIVTFELNGGTLKYATSSTKTRINFAYYPGTYILAPEEIYGYELSRVGYDFTGWYTSENFLPEEKWDFENTPFNTETLTLYAGWRESIYHTYTVYYTDTNGEDVALGTYDITQWGETFSDAYNYAKTRVGYTPIGYYSDKELTTVWNKDFTHPGGAENLDIPVYVAYIAGDWNLVSNYAQFLSAINGNKNVYLTQNIDGANAEFSGKDYTGIIEGNGYTISNLTVKKEGTLIYYCSMFKNLGEGTKIMNVNFENIQFALGTVSANAATSGVRIAALARNANNVTIQNVTVQGTVITDYTGELPRLNEAVYDSENTATVEQFTSNITIVAP